MIYTVNPNKPYDGDRIVANGTWWRYSAVHGRWEDTQERA